MEDSGEEEDSVVDLPDSVIIDCSVRVNIEHLDNEIGQGGHPNRYHFEQT